jgi:predicted RNA-binding protein with PUA-like domain
MKTEPRTFSIDDLKRKPQQIEHWDGVRNYQVRNMMRDVMKIDDLAFFYHSNCPEVGIVGIVRIVKEAYPDSSAFDFRSPQFDVKSDPDNPRWLMVDVQHVRTLSRTITLQELKQHPELADFELLKRGNRLSIMPVSAAQWAFISALEAQDAPSE